MPFSDLRGFLDEAARVGELKEARGVDWDLELGGITDLACHTPGSAAILFDEIKDYAAGYQVAVNLLGSSNRLAIAMDLPANAGDMDLVRCWRTKMKNLPLIPPVEVTSGPVIENVYDGAEVDLLKFPAPKWHELDGGRYIGTGCQVITRDLDTGQVNMGTYRLMLQGKAALGCYISPNKHGRMHREKYWARGEACPVVVVLGCDPRLYIYSSLGMPQGHSELDYAGGLQNAPVPVILGEHTGLPIPSSAEIAFEGEMRSGDLMREGPFGEWTGYYASGEREEQVIRVKRVMHRDNPIIHGCPPVRPPSTFSYYRSIMKSAEIWNGLEAAGVPDVAGVWCHEAGGTRLFNVVAIRQRYPGHAKQAGLIASQCREGIVMGRWVVVVDEDVDPTDLGQVVWAMATRADPARDVDVIRRTLSGELDPAFPPGQKLLGSRAIVEATRPFEWKDEFPAVVQVSALRERALRERWGHLLR